MPKAAAAAVGAGAGAGATAEVGAGVSAAASADGAGNSAAVGAEVATRPPFVRDPNAQVVLCLLPNGKGQARARATTIRLPAPRPGLSQRLGAGPRVQGGRPHGWRAGAGGPIGATIRGPPSR